MVADSASPVTHHEQEKITFHDFRSNKLCRFCERPIMWMYTRTGRRLPFDADLLPVGLDVDCTGWVPGVWPGAGMVMAPVAHYGRDKRARITHVATVHRCPAYLRATAERTA